MDDDRFAWITPPTSEAIGPDHPDYSFWEESFAVEDLAAGGSPTPSIPKPTTRPDVPPVALALSPDMAAAALNVSRDYFDKHVKPALRVITKGSRILVPVRELERWMDENSARALR